MKKANKGIIVVALAAALATGCLVDIRPDDAPAATSVSAAEKGRALLDRAAELQGVDRWRDARTYEVVGRDHWKGLLGKAGNPWPDSDVEVLLQYEYGNFDGRATFLNTKHEGAVWGMQSHRTYKEVDGERAFEQDDDQAFILAAYHYFFEFAERIRKVPVARWTGTETIDGVRYDVVYASWGEEPTNEYDQYVVYVNQDTGLIEKAFYTLRDFAGFFTGTIHFGDWRKVDGALFPFRQTVTAKPDSKLEKYFHELTVKEVRIGAFPVAALEVDETLPEVGDAKL